MPSIAERSWRTRRSASCAGAPSPSTWRASSAGTLEGVGCDGRFAVHRGSPGRGSLPPSPLRPVPREDVRPAVHDAGSPQGTRAGRATRRGAPASGPARGCAAHARLTRPPCPTRASGDRRKAPRLEPVAGDPGSPAGPGASRRYPMSTRSRAALGRGLGGRACAALGLRTREPPSDCPPRRERFPSPWRARRWRSEGSCTPTRPCAQHVVLRMQRRSAAAARQGLRPPSAGSQPAPRRDGLRRRSSGAR
jgi:hypothetical protein